MVAYWYMGYRAHWCIAGYGDSLVTCVIWWLIGVLCDVVAHLSVVGCGGSLIHILWDILYWYIVV
jgi:hypothetical protein